MFRDRPSTSRPLAIHLLYWTIPTCLLVDCSRQVLRCVSRLPAQVQQPQRRKQRRTLMDFSHVRSFADHRHTKAGNTNASAPHTDVLNCAVAGTRCYLKRKTSMCLVCVLSPTPPQHSSNHRLRSLQYDRACQHTYMKILSYPTRRSSQGCCESCEEISLHCVVMDHSPQTRALPD